MAGYTPLTDGDRERMLELLGVDGEDELLGTIPEGLRLDRPLAMEDGLSETEVHDRLSDLAGPEQILATDTVIRKLGKGSGVRSRSLGPMRIKGRVEPCEVFRIEWQTEMLSEFLTLPADLHALRRNTESVFGGIELGWLDASLSFNLTDLPLKIGRAPEADFVVNDPRVSRMHANIDIRSGNYVLEDTSSYGTWVRFAGTDNVIALRRQECLLHSDGEIAMGAPFTDFSTPSVSFRLVDGSMVLGRGPLSL